MTEGLAVPGAPGEPGTPVDIEAGKTDFARMMAKSADGESGTEAVSAPPKRIVDTEDPGYTPNPKRGRPTKATRARTKDVDVTAKKTESLPPKDFTGDLNAVADGLWIGLSQLPFTAPYAAVLHLNQAPLVASLNQGAQVNSGVRNYIEKMTSGAGSAWMLNLALVGANIGMQAFQVAKDPELRAGLVEANKQQVQEYIQQITGAAAAVA